jgi:molecular chaperone HtpG
MQDKSQHSFQVNLAGIIELLSHHLYSGPQVFLRELLQNATDAIQARRQLDKSSSFEGLITIELTEGAEPTLAFEDNGIGLTEEEVHQFLATIGLSSKRDELARQREEFIGQFGIGLVSGFLVTDEIVMVTQSARPGQPALEWRGLGSGSYSLRRLREPRREPGTTVFLRAKAAATEQFQRDCVVHHLKNYGGLLPHRIEFVCGRAREPLNAARPPWEQRSDSPGQWREAALDYGRQTFEQEFLDCFPLRVPEAGIQGVGFVMAVSPSLASRRADRLYLKNMLLAENAEHLLPEWAFFVRCALNATKLNPNAAREGLQQDARLEAAQKGLEKNLRDYLLGLARHDHERLRRLLAVHYRAIKVLAPAAEHAARGSRRALAQTPALGAGNQQFGLPVFLFGTGSGLCRAANEEGSLLAALPMADRRVPGREERRCTLEGAFRVDGGERG